MFLIATASRGLTVGFLVAAAGSSLAQAPTIISVVPRANTVAAARATTLFFNFNQPLTGASADALQVFSHQYLGLTTTADAAGTARLVLPAGLAPGLYLVRSGGRSQRLVVE